MTHDCRLVSHGEETHKQLSHTHAHMHSTVLRLKPSPNSEISYEFSFEKSLVSVFFKKTSLCTREDFLPRFNYPFLRIRTVHGCYLFRVKGIKVEHDQVLESVANKKCTYECVCVCVCVCECIT